MGLLPSGERRQTGLSGPVVASVGLVLLALAPLIRGGNRHAALIVLEIIALVMMPMLAWRVTTREGVSRAQSVGIIVLALSPFWVGLFQLVPLPPDIWAMLPGHGPYVDALTSVQAPTGVWRPASVTPDATWLSLLAGLPVAATFLLAWLVSGPQLVLLLRAVTFFAVFQAVMGLLQVVFLPELFFGAGPSNRAIGSFANPNHLASYLAMVLPLIILFFRQALALRSRPGSESAARSRNRSQSRLSKARAGSPAAATAWGLALFLVLAAMLATLSRAGLASGLIVGLAAALLLPSGETSAPQRRWRLAAVVAFGVLVSVSVGLDGLLQRIAVAANDADEATRLQLFMATWEGARAFWPFGSGLGSYASVFLRFKPSGISGYAEYAHSDYVQLLMECGALFVALAAVAAWLIARQFRPLARRLHRHPGDPDALLQISCGLGLLAVFLHSWLDFNLHIPANAMLAAFLFGAFLRPVKLRSGADPQRHAYPG